MVAKDIMVTEVITVKKADTVQYVTNLLMKNNVSGFPVVDEENRVIGMVTEADLIHRCKKLEIPLYFNLLDGYIFVEGTKKLEEQVKKMVAYQVADIMTEKPIVVDEDDDIEKIATIMTNQRVNRVPVVREGKLAGIVSRRDIIQAISK
jgi:CBS domain-containing protein